MHLRADCLCPEAGRAGYARAGSLPQAGYFQRYLLHLAQEVGWDFYLEAETYDLIIFGVRVNMKTLLTSQCINQRGAGHLNHLHKGKCIINTLLYEKFECFRAFRR